MAGIRYIDPLFKELLDQVPKEKRRKSALSYGLARRIHEVLQRKNLSQADLARQTGKSEGLVSRWLSGTHNFTIQTIAEIETALGEELLSIRQYRRISNLVGGYNTPPVRAAMFNDGEAEKENT